MQLILLSGGAAEGLVGELRHEFQFSTGCGIAGTFGAVGAMREKLLAGQPADLILLTSPLIAELTRSGHVRLGSAVAIGRVHTGVAVRAGDPTPPLADAQALRSALLAADAIHFPDPKLATAGIHFAKVLDGLGLADALRSRLRPAPNGTAAMRALAAAAEPRPIGCTQVTEILHTPGITFAGPLPKPFELVSLYTAAVCTHAQLPGQAARLAALLAGDPARYKREQAGFGPLA
ncbi:MAG TPA: substrate-binding domain-containing protein [Hyphomicrobiaceae bacterium]